MTIPLPVLQNINQKKGIQKPLPKIFLLLDLPMSNPVLHQVLFLTK